MFGWNVCARLLAPGMRTQTLTAIMRATILTLGVAAVLMAIKVQSVQALWFFTSDLVFVLLFPQLVSALFDSKANLIGSVAAFTVSLIPIGRGRAAVRRAGVDSLSGMDAVSRCRRWSGNDPAAGRLTPDRDDGAGTAFESY